MDKEYVCEECDAEFNVDYDFIATPDFCPFCGNKLEHGDRLVDYEWEEDNS